MMGRKIKNVHSENVGYVTGRGQLINGQLLVRVSESVDSSIGEWVNLEDVLMVEEPPAVPKPGEWPRQ